VATTLLVAGATRWLGKLNLQNHVPCLTLILWETGQTQIAASSSYSQLASFKCCPYIGS